MKFYFLISFFISCIISSQFITSVFIYLLAASAKSVHLIKFIGFIRKRKKPPLFCFFKAIRVNIATNKVSFQIFANFCSCKTSSVKICNQIAFIATCFYNSFNQCFWFLCIISKSFIAHCIYNWYIIPNIPNRLSFFIIMPSFIFCFIIFILNIVCPFICFRIIQNLDIVLLPMLVIPCGL